MGRETLEMRGPQFATEKTLVAFRAVKALLWGCSRFSGSVGGGGRTFLVGRIFLPVLRAVLRGRETLIAGGATIPGG